MWVENQGGMSDAEAAIAERYRLMSVELNERQRRRFAASEARTFGRGGIAAAARACGLAENTVRKGLSELEEPESLGPDRVRREGAGRPAGEDSDPGLLDALRALVGDDVRGDPERVLLWTSKSVRNLAQELGAQGHQAGKDLVARLLKGTLGFSDCGGSNGNRTRLWKTELQKLADDSGLEIVVCHFPPGTSKWNKVEHRLFSFISRNWRGQPLISYEVIINLIAATTTSTGLEVYARLDQNEYPKVDVTDAELAAVNLTRDAFHGEWNYSINPSNN